MKKFLINCIILLIFYQLGNSQPSHAKNEYINFINKFYFHLLKDDTVTVKEYIELFSIYAIENEAYLFNAICDRNPENTVCKERGINSLANEWGNYSSLVFNELKEFKNHFTQGYDDKMDSIIKCCAKFYDEGSVSSIALDVTFPNGQTVYFYLNRYPDEPISIINIYLEDGVYFYTFFDKYITKPEEKGDTSTKYLKRMAIINEFTAYVQIRKGKGNEYPVVGEINKNEMFYFTPSFYNEWWKVKNIDGSIEGYLQKEKIIPFGELSTKKKKEIAIRYQFLNKKRS